jgi:tRNA A37 methylthiotransferase MiaB
LEDDIPQEVKEARVEEIMEIQSQISWEKIRRRSERLSNVSLIGKKVIILSENRI